MIVSGLLLSVACGAAGIACRIYDLQTAAWVFAGAAICWFIGSVAQYLADTAE